MRACRSCRAGSWVIALFAAALCRGVPQTPAQVSSAVPSLRFPRRVVSFEHVNQELILKCDVGLMTLRAAADNIIHAAYFPGPLKSALPRWGLSAYPPAAKYRVDSTPGAVRLAASQIAVSVERKSAQLTFTDAKQNVLLVSRQFQLKESETGGRPTFQIHAEFGAPEGEEYYGLGGGAGDGLDRRGQTIQIGADSRNGAAWSIAAPFLVTNRGYAFLFDNASQTSVSPGKNGVTSWDAEAGGALSFFVVCGSTYDDLYRGYRHLTGAVPLPPKSALGFVFGGKGYRTGAELLQDARGYREKEIPADVLVVDPGEAGFDEKGWPDPAGLNAELKKLSYDVVVACRPAVPQGSAAFSALESMGCFPRDRKGQVVVSADRGAQTLLVDATRAQCASWYWNSVQEQYGSKGFTGWWLDNQAPAIPAASFFLSAGVAAEVLNYYPSAFARALYEGHRKDRTDRCWILSDAAFTGTQRFGASFRLPDARPVWEELRRQVASGLSVAASGFPFWSTEIGGPAAGRDPADFPELFVRWVEFGAFCPTFKMHESRRGDIGTYGAAVEGAAAKFLRLRYRLLPYIYSQARAAAESGAPFTRPLFMDFPQDSEARDLVDEYMFGPAFLVAPVLEGSAALREVYLPAGTSWYDFWTGKKFAGGQWVSADATLAVLPLFVRAGSIIPLGNEITSSRAAQRDVELRVYAGADGRFDLYQDDGTSYEYEQGKFSLAQIRWSDASQKISVSGDDRKLLARPQSEWLRVVK